MVTGERASTPRRRRNLRAMVATVAALLCVGLAGRAAFARPSMSEAGTPGSTPLSVDARREAAASASAEGGRGEAGEGSDPGGRLARALLLFLALGLLPAALRPRRG